MSRMIVVTRNGRTYVLTGWKAWLAGAVSMVVAWAMLALVASLVIGVGLTVGVLMLLAIPAILGVGLISSALRRTR